MDILLFLRYFSFIVYCFLAVFVLWQDSKSTLHRVCAAYLVCFAIWVFGDFYILNTNSPRDLPNLVNNIVAISWCSFSSIFLWLILIFTERKNILKLKLFYPAIFAPPALFLYKQWTGFMISYSHKESYGWAVMWSDSIWIYLFYLYYLSFMLGSIYLLFEFREKTKESIKKKQAGIIAVTMIIPIVLGSISDALLPALHIYDIPPIANIFSSIWAGGLVYAIVKYKFLTIHRH
jgi:hypothetical protein